MNPNLLIDQSRQFEKGMYLRRRTPERQRHFEQGLNKEGTECGLRWSEERQKHTFHARFRSLWRRNERKGSGDWPVRLGGTGLDLRLGRGSRLAR